jgi:hypothetical protein
LFERYLYLFVLFFQVFTITFRCRKHFSQLLDQRVKGDSISYSLEKTLIKLKLIMPKGKYK